MNTSLMHPAALQHLGANKPEEMCILRSDHNDHDHDDHNDHDHDHDGYDDDDEP